MQPLPKIPGYLLLKALGGGPLSSVYQAHDKSTDIACAVKVLKEEWADRSSAIKLLQREARAGLSVQHPHLVRFRHVHVTRPPYFVDMELLSGESLQRRLRRIYRLDLATALWIARQSAEALAALHQAGFLHGDVKPDNILLIDDGKAVLIDLGFAHRPGENIQLFEQGFVLGTADYLAPEMCDSDITDDSASDLFSFGVTLFEMISGRLPYPKGTLQQTFRRHASDPPAEIRQLVPETPTALANLIGRLLSHRPQDRPRARAVVQQLIALEIATIHRRHAA